MSDLEVHSRDDAADPAPPAPLGAVAIVVPLYYLTKPGQPTPYNWFPYAAAIIVVISILYATVLTRRDPELGERVGSLIADAE